MSDDIAGRIYGSPKKGRKVEAAGGELQERVAQQLLDPELVPEPTLRKVVLALGTESREDSVALVRADIQAAKLAARIIRSSEPGEQLGAVPPIATTNPVRPATSKSRAGLKF